MTCTHSSSVPCAEERDSGLAGVNPIPWGTHFCAFYETQADLVEIASPYLHAGLTSGERCLWLTCDPLTPNQARTALLHAVPDAGTHIGSGDIEIRSAEEWYRPGGTFEAGRVIDAWRRVLEEAHAKGLRGLRVYADESWLPRSLWEEFAAYEALLDQAFAGEKIIVLCSYPLSGASASDVFDVAGTHQFTIARRNGEWNLLESADAIGARAELKRINSELERLVDERASKLRQAHSKLEKREALFRFVTENINDGIALHDLEARRVYASPAIYRQVGEPPEDSFARVHPDDLPRIMQAWQEMVRGKSKAVTFRHQHSDGSWKWLEASGRRILYEGKPHVLVVLRDVGERIRLEEHLHHAQKLEAVGRLAGGVAHDFNNLLTAIYGYADLASRDLPPDNPAQLAIEEIKLAAERAQRVARQLLTFSRRDVLQPQPVDLGSAICGMEGMLRLLLREDIRLDVRPCQEPVTVFIDPTQLEQLIVNLVTNARDAVGPDGLIQLSCEAEQTSTPDAGIPPFVKPGEYARIRVTDTGKGMDRVTLQRAFEPFFTTKAPGVGTGLGLSAVFGISKQAGGYVWIDSEEGAGTSVTILLPRSRIAPAVAEPAPPARETSLEGRNILVVEDEDLVRHFVASVLRRRGAQVVEVPSPAEALAFLGDPARPLDLLISDVVMPGMSGPALAGLAQRARPGISSLLMSGYAADEEALADPRSRAAVLKKPFRPDELLRRVESALRKKDGAAANRRDARRRSRSDQASRAS